MLPSDEALKCEEDMLPSDEALKCKEDMLPSDEALKCEARYSARRTCYHLMKP